MKNSADTLNELLRGELSAVETYNQALQKIEEPFIAREELKLCQAAHQARAALLSRAVANLGAAPSTTSGAWGTFAKLVEGSAKLLGGTMAVAALEEGEDHGLAEYERALDQVDEASRAFIERDLLPGQQETHRAINGIKRAMAA